jgi:hypothetical protein
MLLKGFPASTLAQFRPASKVLYVPRELAHISWLLFEFATIIPCVLVPVIPFCLTWNVIAGFMAFTDIFAIWDEFQSVPHSVPGVLGSIVRHSKFIWLFTWLQEAPLSVVL